MASNINNKKFIEGFMEYILNTLSSFLFICFIAAIFIVGGAVGYIVAFLNCSKSYKGLIAYVENDFKDSINNIMKE
ncbi:hypothetical protein [Clostridium butyricum]